jgi:hypothetical protein
MAAPVTSAFLPCNENESIPDSEDLAAIMTPIGGDPDWGG